MLVALRHRGPDRARIWSTDDVALGCARLVIVGGETATQPDLAESSALVFNGEIFNYRELRATLPAPSTGWRTNGDAEVLHRLLQVEGVNGLQQIEGQFALAWWDDRRRQLTLARDRDGIAPLYYTTGPEGARFSSEVWSLIEAGTNNGVSYDASIATAVLWGTPPEASAFTGIKQVAPGGIVVFDQHGLTLRTAWDRAQTATTAPRDPTARELEEAVRRAVHRRVPADVTWGLMLSGGLDSAVIATVAANPDSGNRPDAAYGVQFVEANDLDEREHQEVVARALGLNLVPVPVSHRMIANNFIDTVYSAGSPLIRLAPVATRILAREAHADGMRVLLSGEGADERFHGYSVLRRGATNPQQPRAVRLLGAPTRAGLPPAHATRWITTAGKIAGVLATGTTGSALFEHIYSTYVSEWLSSLGDKHPAEGGRRARQIEEHFFLHSALLASQSDRMLMSQSVEGRFPFLDRDVTTIADAMREESLVNDDIEKRLLRLAFESQLPAPVVWRPKHPYSAPDAAFWRSSLGFALLTDLLNPTSVSSIGWLSWSKVQWHLRRIQSGSPLSVFDELAITWMASCAVLDERSTDARAA